MKLGVCIPYRDNGDGVRKEHLDRLIPHLEQFFGERNIDFTCYVGHQIDDEKFLVTKGDIVLIPDGAFHKVINTSHLGLFFVCVFDGDRYK